MLLGVEALSQITLKPLCFLECGILGRQYPDLLSAYEEGESAEGTQYRFNYR